MKLFRLFGRLLCLYFVMNLLSSCEKETNRFSFETNLPSKEVTMTNHEILRNCRFVFTSFENPERVYCMIEDLFICGLISHKDSKCLSTYDTLRTYAISLDLDIVPFHVGHTTLHFIADDYDTSFIIRVIPEYYTFEEPMVDFDDNIDSVIHKYRNNQFSEHTPGSISYTFNGTRGIYTLTVNFDEAGIVSNFVVRLANHSDDLEAFLSERYHKVDYTHQGKPVWLKAYNIPNPSVAESIFGAIISEDGYEVTYMKPTDI